MTTPQQIEQLMHSRVVDETGGKVGDVAQVYLDDDTGNPSWVTVRTGFFGTRETFIPLRGSRQDGDDIFVPYSKSFIKDAPSFDDDGDAHLDSSAQDELFRYYGAQDHEAEDGGHDSPARHDTEDGGHDSSAGHDSPGDRDLQREPVDELDHPHGRERDVRNRDRHPGEYRAEETSTDAAGAQRDRDRTYETQQVVESTPARQGGDRRDTGRMRLRRHVVTEVVDGQGNPVGRLADDDDAAAPNTDPDRNVGGP